MQYGESDRVDLCTSGAHNALILHELAHAWEHHRMSDLTRERFLNATGMEWYGPELPWRERGIEAVAVTVTWGLLNAPLTAAEVESSRERAGLFELLTGVPSPRLPGPSTFEGGDRDLLPW